VTPDRVRALSSVLLDPHQAAGLELHGRVPAAVLVALFIRRSTLHTVLTRRRDDLRNHPGQISFPGGRRDPTDADLIQTALREADEEIGLAPATVELIGALPPVSTMVTDFAVHPFVALIAPPVALRPAPLEVEAVLELSIPVLAASHARRTLDVGRRSVRTDCYTVGTDVVWGATARILADLLDRLALLTPATTS